MLQNSAIKLARTASTLFPLLQGISSISLLILIGLGTYQLDSGFISIGGLVALILYVERLVFPGTFRFHFEYFSTWTSKFGSS